MEHETPQQEHFNPHGMTKVELKTTAKGEIQIALHVYGNSPLDAAKMAIDTFQDIQDRLGASGHRVASDPQRG